MKSSLYVVTVLISMSVAACAKSKVDQCNAFVDNATKAQTTVAALTLDSDDPTVLQKNGADIEAAAKALGTLELKDEKLVGFHKDYTDLLTNLGKIVGDLGTAAGDAKDEAKAEAATAKANQLIESANALEKKESDLVDAINTYCSAE